MKMSTNVQTLPIGQLDIYIEQVFKAPSRVKLAKEHVRAYPGKCFFMPTRAKKLAVPCEESPLEHGFCEKHVSMGYSHAPGEWEKMLKLIQKSEPKKYVSINEDPEPIVSKVKKSSPKELESKLEEEPETVLEEPEHEEEQESEETALEEEEEQAETEVETEESEEESDTETAVGSESETESESENESDESESADESESDESESESESESATEDDEDDDDDEDIDPEDSAVIPEHSDSDSDSELIPTKVRRNRFGNYEHSETHFVFDIATRTVFGVQKKDGSIKSLDSKDIKICTKNGWNYFVPSRVYKKE